VCSYFLVFLDDHFLLYDIIVFLSEHCQSGDLYVSNSCYFAAKFGVDPSGCVGLAKHVKISCPNLVFSGLMTIGMLDYSSTPENFKVIF
jgi:hypothetical protein